MRVRLLFFGVVGDIVGARSAELELEIDAAPDGGVTLETVFEQYASQFPKLREMSRSILVARNQQFASRKDRLEDGDEVAFLPPVSGGSGSGSGGGPAPDERYTHAIEDPAGHFFALTRAPLDTREIAARLLRGQDGALVTFEGVVRNNTAGRATRFLDYECYEAMAIQVMAGLGRWLAAAFPIDRIALVHRLGRLEIGETSVLVAVSAPHRKPAFEAALEGINRLKKTVPIWKKEYFADGEVWVEGEWDDRVAGSS